MEDLKQWAQRKGKALPVKDNEYGIGNAFMDAALGGVQTLAGLPSDLAHLADVGTSLVTGKSGIGKAFDETSIGQALRSVQEEAQQSMSPQSQEAMRELHEALKQYDKPKTEGLSESAGKLLSQGYEAAKQIAQNPELLPSLIGQAAPYIMSIRGGAKLLTKLAPKLSPAVASGISEGALTAGGAANQLTNEQGELERRGALGALATGVATAGISTLSGKVAGKLGLEDIDIPGKAPVPSKIPTLAKPFVSGATEAIEEGLQGGSEQAIQNITEGKPWHEAVGGQSVIEGMVGGLTGHAMETKKLIFEEVAKARRKAKLARLKELEQKLAEMQGEKVSEGETVDLINGKKDDAKQEFKNDAFLQALDSVSNPEALKQVIAEEYGLDLGTIDKMLDESKNKRSFVKKVYDAVGSLPAKEYARAIWDVAKATQDILANQEGSITAETNKSNPVPLKLPTTLEKKIKNSEVRALITDKVMVPGANVTESGTLIHIDRSNLKSISDLAGWEEYLAKQAGYKNFEEMKASSNPLIRDFANGKRKAYVSVVDTAKTFVENIGLFKDPEKVPVLPKPKDGDFPFEKMPNVVVASDSRTEVAKAKARRSAKASAIEIKDLKSFVPTLASHVKQKPGHTPIILKHSNLFDSIKKYGNYTQADLDRIIFEQVLQHFGNEDMKAKIPVVVADDNSGVSEAFVKAMRRLGYNAAVYGKNRYVVDEAGVKNSDPNVLTNRYKVRPYDANETQIKNTVLHGAFKDGNLELAVDYILHDKEGFFSFGNELKREELGIEERKFLEKVASAALAEVRADGKTIKDIIDKISLDAFWALDEDKEGKLKKKTYTKEEFENLAKGFQDTLLNLSKILALHEKYSIFKTEEDAEFFKKRAKILTSELKNLDFFKRLRVAVSGYKANPDAGGFARAFREAVPKELVEWFIEGGPQLVEKLNDVIRGKEAAAAYLRNIIYLSKSWKEKLIDETLGAKDFDVEERLRLIEKNEQEILSILKGGEETVFEREPEDHLDNVDQEALFFSGARNTPSFSPYGMVEDPIERARLEELDRESLRVMLQNDPIAAREHRSKIYKRNLSKLADIYQKLDISPLAGMDINGNLIEEIKKDLDEIARFYSIDWVLRRIYSEEGISSIAQLSSYPYAVTEIVNRIREEKAYEEAAQTQNANKSEAKARAVFEQGEGQVEEVDDEEVQPDIPSGFGSKKSFMNDIGAIAEQEKFGQEKTKTALRIGNILASNAMKVARLYETYKDKGDKKLAAALGAAFGLPPIPNFILNVVKKHSNLGIFDRRVLGKLRSTALLFLSQDGTWEESTALTRVEFLRSLEKAGYSRKQAKEILDIIPKRFIGGSNKFRVSGLEDFLAAVGILGKKTPTKNKMPRISQIARIVDPADEFGAALLYNFYRVAKQFPKKAKSIGASQEEFMSLAEAIFSHFTKITTGRGRRNESSKTTSIKDIGLGAAKALREKYKDSKDHFFLRLSWEEQNAVVAAMLNTFGFLSSFPTSEYKGLQVQNPFGDDNRLDFKFDKETLEKKGVAGSLEQEEDIYIPATYNVLTKELIANSEYLAEAFGKGDSYDPYETIRDIEYINRDMGLRKKFGEYKYSFVVHFNDLVMMLDHAYRGNLVSEDEVIETIEAFRNEKLAFYQLVDAKALGRGVNEKTKAHEAAKARLAELVNSVRAKIVVDNIGKLNQVTPEELVDMADDYNLENTPYKQKGVLYSLALKALVSHSDPKLYMRGLLQALEEKTAFARVQAEMAGLALVEDEKALKERAEQIASEYVGRAREAATDAFLLVAKNNLIRSLNLVDELDTEEAIQYLKEVLPESEAKAYEKKIIEDPHAFAKEYVATILPTRYVPKTHPLEGYAEQLVSVEHGSEIIEKATSGEHIGNTFAERERKALSRMIEDYVNADPNNKEAAVERAIDDWSDTTLLNAALPSGFRLKTKYTEAETILVDRYGERITILRPTGKMNGFIELFRKTYNVANVIFVAGNVKSQYDGKTDTVIVNVRDDFSADRIIGHEFFHSIANKVSPDVMNGIYDDIANIVGKEYFYETARNLMRESSDLSEGDAKQEVAAEIFASLFGTEAFYKYIANKHGKKLAPAFLELVQKGVELYEGATLKPGLIGSVFVSNLNKGRLADVFAYMLNTSVGSSMLYDGKVRYHTVVGYKTVDELKSILRNAKNWLSGVWEKIFPKGSKERLGIIRTFENHFANVINFIKQHKPGFIYADMGVDKLIVDEMQKIQNASAFLLEQEMKGFLEGAKKGFDEWIDESRTKMFDRIKAGKRKLEIPISILKDFNVNLADIPNAERMVDDAGDLYVLVDYDPNNEMHRKALLYGYKHYEKRFLEKFHDKYIRGVWNGGRGYSPEEMLQDGVPEHIVQVFRKFKEKADEVYRELAEHFPDLEYRENHYGQSVKWHRKDGTPATDFFDFPSKSYSKLAGNKRYLERKADEKTAALGKKYQIEYDTIHPVDLFTSYMKDAKRYAYLMRFLKKGQFLKDSNGDAMVKIFSDPKQAAAQGYFTIDDNSLILYRALSLEDTGLFAIREKKKEEGKENEPLPEKFRSEEDAKRWLEENELDQNKYEIIKHTTDSEDVEVARYYMKPGALKMLRILSARDKLREFQAFGIKARSIINLKNAANMVEFAFSLFHASVIGMESIATNVSLGYLQGGGGLKGVKSAIKKANPLETIRTVQKATAFFEYLVANPDAGTDPILLKEAERLFGYKDGDLMDAIHMYYNVGGRIGMDPTLRAKTHDLGVVKYKELPPTLVIEDGKVVYKNISLLPADLKTIRQTIKNVWDDEVRKHPESRIVPAVKTGAFAALEMTTAWLMENTIPRVKFMFWMNEYAHKLKAYEKQIFTGQMTRQEIARDTMKFVEDRFGEVNWDNMWMHPSLKTALQFTFRSFTWFTGSWKAMGKAALDVGMKGWFTLTGRKGEYKLTEKGVWGISAIFAHLSVAAMVYGGYLALAGIQGAEVPDDEDTPLIGKILFPRIDPLDPTSRVAIPSYVMEAYKFLSHIGLTNTEMELTKLVSGRFNSLIGNFYEVLNNQTWDGRMVSDPSDPFLVRAAKSVAHIFSVAPISLSSLYGFYERKGFQVVPSVLSFFGFTTAPAYVKRSRATNLAYAYRRMEHSGTTIDDVHLDTKKAFNRAMIAWAKGDSEDLEKMVDEGKVTMTMVKNALKKLPIIKGKPNPLYEPELKRALKSLTFKSSLKVWEEMTDNEKERTRPMMLQKLQNMIEHGATPRSEMLALVEKAKNAGIIPK